MSGMVVILLFIIFIAWLAIDLGVGKKVFSQAENTFSKAPCFSFFVRRRECLV